MSIFGGYKTQTVIQLANVLSALKAKNITLRQLRIYFACLVITAAREAAERSREDKKQGSKISPRYLLKELNKLTGCPILRIRGELKKLELVGLLCFSESAIVFTETPLPGSHSLKEILSGGRSSARPVPLPRTVLRFIASCPKNSTIQTMLAYCLRGLALSRKGEVTCNGTAKASWIADTLGLSIRSVRSSRAGLINLKFISDDENSYQRKLNRDGAYFSINLDWKRAEKALEETKEGTLKELKEEPKTVDNSPLECHQIAPPLAQNCHYLAPPYKDKKTLNRSKYQETQRSEPAGVCKANDLKREEKSNVIPLPANRKVNIRNVKAGDLKEFSLLEELFFQAVRAGIVDDSESAAVNFLAAAVKVKRVVGDPVKIFMGIVRKRLWSHISQADEDRALSLLRKHREKDSQRFRVQMKRAA